MDGRTNPTKTLQDSVSLSVPIEIERWVTACGWMDGWMDGKNFTKNNHDLLYYCNCRYTSPKASMTSWVNNLVSNFQIKLFTTLPNHTQIMDLNEHGKLNQKSKIKMKEKILKVLKFHLCISLSLMFQQ
jgi:hypothetical protein